MSGLALIGFMGVGKTTLGRILAERLAWPFLDLDREIERETGRPIHVIFEEEGEQAFRLLESGVLAALPETGEHVLACGGGVVLDGSNRRILSGRYTVVYLHLSWDALWRRLEGLASPERPLLYGRAEGEVRLEFQRREPHYRAVADLVLETGGVPMGSLAEEVLGRLGG